jgi:hypothetical protein
MGASGAGSWCPAVPPRAHALEASPSQTCWVWRPTCRPPPARGRDPAVRARRPHEARGLGSAAPAWRVGLSRWGWAWASSVALAPSRPLLLGHPVCFWPTCRFCLLGDPSPLPRRVLATRRPRFTARSATRTSPRPVTRPAIPAPVPHPRGFEPHKDNTQSSPHCCPRSRGSRDPIGRLSWERHIRVGCAICSLAVPQIPPVPRDPIPAGLRGPPPPPWDDATGRWRSMGGQGIGALMTFFPQHLARVSASGNDLGRSGSPAAGNLMPRGRAKVCRTAWRGLGGEPGNCHPLPVLKNESRVSRSSASCPVLDSSTWDR